jgi:hypothetical protein
VYTSCCRNPCTCALALLWRIQFEFQSIYALCRALPKLDCQPALWWWHQHRCRKLWQLFCRSRRLARAAQQTVRTSAVVAIAMKMQGLLHTALVEDQITQTEVEQRPLLDKFDGIYIIEIVYVQ